MNVVELIGYACEYSLHLLGDSVCGALRRVHKLRDSGSIFGSEADVDRGGVSEFQRNGSMGEICSCIVLVNSDVDHHRVWRFARAESKRDAVRHSLHALQPRFDFLPHRQHD